MKFATLRRIIKLIKLATIALPPVIALVGGSGLVRVTGPDGPGGDPVPHDPVPV